jgi:hypothetical protein
MKVRVIPIPKERLNTIPPIEKAFYIHIGHLRNELMTLLRLASWSVNNNDGGNPLLVDVNVCQSQFYTRLLAGKLHECWLFLDRAYTKEKLTLTLGNELSTRANDSFESLKKYFGRTAMMSDVRQKFAMHYDLEKIREQLEKVEDSDNLNIVVGRTEWNNYYQLSEVIVGSAMLNTVKSGNHREAAEKFYKEVTEVTRYFINFADECMKHMINKHIGNSPEAAGAFDFEIPKPQSDSATAIPYFTTQKSETFD